MTTPRLLLPLLLAHLAPTAGAAASHAIAFPFSCILDKQDLLARVMRGGCWLAGLPGYPRYNGARVHAGVDFRATLGEPIFAIMDGVVDPTSDVPHSGYGPGWKPGQCLIVRSQIPAQFAQDLPEGAEELVMIYGHTQRHRVMGGQVIRAGDLLGEVGPWLDNEGGPHLHVTVRLGQLPRYGWGTPTLVGNPVREGAEAVACEADVLKIGYRHPLLLWQ